MAGEEPGDCQQRAGGRDAQEEEMGETFYEIRTQPGAWERT